MGRTYCWRDRKGRDAVGFAGQVQCGANHVRASGNLPGRCVPRLHHHLQNHDQVSACIMRWTHSTTGLTCRAAGTTSTLPSTSLVVGEKAIRHRQRENSVLRCADLESRTCATGRYSLVGGSYSNGRPASAPKLHRTRALPYPLSAGKRAAPTEAEGVQLFGSLPGSALGKATAHSPPSTETRIVPVSRSRATPRVRVLPASNQPGATGSLPLWPLPV
jgi:hypothetical protein